MLIYLTSGFRQRAKGQKVSKNVKKEKTYYPDAREYYPKVFHCSSCGRFTHGIEAGRFNPLKICNACAVPIEYSSDGEFVRDADGSVSFA